MAGSCSAGARFVVETKIDVNAIERAARNRMRDQLLVMADAARLRLRTASLQVAVSIETLEHVPDPERVVFEIARVLVPGSPFIVTTPNRLSSEIPHDNPYHVREFDRAFTKACLELGIEHHKLPPRSPDLNAFVERFQGTCLHLHYRTAFRYRSYTSAADIDADLQAFLRHYNFERPHRGYRTKGPPSRRALLRRQAHTAQAERMGPR